MVEIVKYIIKTPRRVCVFSTSRPNKYSRSYFIEGRGQLIRTEYDSRVGKMYAVVKLDNGNEIRSDYSHVKLDKT